MRNTGSRQTLLRSLALARTLVATSLVLSACSEPAPVNLGGDYKVVLAMPPAVTKDIDILFVLDTSFSMADNIQALSTQLSTALFNPLENVEGALPNIHVGVITSDMGTGNYSVPGCDAKGDGGVLLNKPTVAECTPPDGRFIVNVADATGIGRITNYSGTIEDTFRCIATRKISGCGFEQPFLAVQKAISGTVPENEGFIRPNALLMVVIVSDEDDCSSPDSAIFDPNDPTLGSSLGFRCFEHAISCDGDNPRALGVKTGCTARANPHVLALATLKDSLVAAKGGDPAMVMVAAISGPKGPVQVTMEDYAGSKALSLGDACESTSGLAKPAVRLLELLDLFPGRSWAESLCDNNMWAILNRTGNAVGDVMGRRTCLRGNLLDTAPAQEGLQPDCRAFLVDKPFTPAEVRKDLVHCTADAEREGEGDPCFEVVPDEGGCGTGSSGLKANFRSRGTSLEGKHLLVECRAP